MRQAMSVAMAQGLPVPPGGFGPRYRHVTTGRWCPDEAELGEHLRTICPITATMLSHQPRTADTLASAEASAWVGAWLTKWEGHDGRDGHL
jgi:hypothetical protein